MAKKQNQLSLAYIAGIIDGEGCISILKKTNERKDLILGVAVGMSSPIIPYALRNQFGGTVVVTLHGREKPQWRWRVQARVALAFLKVILPYLVEKTQQAEVAICFQENRMPPGRHDRQKSEKHRAVEEAQHILLKQLKHNTRLL